MPSYISYGQDDESIAGSDDSYRELFDEQTSDDEDRVDLGNDEDSSVEVEEDEEEVQIGDTQREWKIQHASGDIKLKGMSNQAYVLTIRT
jgi:hypothetical protein